ncbi:MAG: hypothetical protein ACRDC3_12185 [Paraclostridium dentum]|uniref:hypothetical protein n=1 Tax=Paraclostridium dentum TaxID=2662455 RepID=UPI003EE4EF74
MNKYSSVFIITNIPNRQKSYIDKETEKSARKSIIKYINMLSYEKFIPHVSVYFNFENHAKIIITDENLYIGSQNYSYGSKNNIECGIISSNKDLILFFKNKIKKIIKDSTPYNDEIFNIVNFLNIQATLIELRDFINNKLLYDYDLLIKTHGLFLDIKQIQCMSDFIIDKYDEFLEDDYLETINSYILKVKEIYNLKYELKKILKEIQLFKDSLESEKNKYMVIIKKLELLDSRSIYKLVNLIEENEFIHILCEFDIYESIETYNRLNKIEHKAIIQSCRESLEDYINEDSKKRAVLEFFYIVKLAKPYMENLVEYINLVSFNTRSFVELINEYVIKNERNINNTNKKIIFTKVTKK